MLVSNIKLDCNLSFLGILQVQLVHGQFYNDLLDFLFIWIFHITNDGKFL